MHMILNFNNLSSRSQDVNIIIQLQSKKYIKNNLESNNTQCHILKCLSCRLVGCSSISLLVNMCVDIANGAQSLSVALFFNPNVQHSKDSVDVMLPL